MNIFNEVVRGAAQQFGREFGRAGANAVLKGKNYYEVKSSSNYSGRIKPSDSPIVKSIKEINKIQFVTTNKANISRLIDATDIMLDTILFNGVSTLNQINDLKALLDNYNDKFEHGSVLVDDDFKDKSVDFLKLKRERFISQLKTFNTETRAHIKTNLELTLKKKRNKKTAILLSCPFIMVGCLGFHKFYLKESRYGFLYIILFLVYGLSSILSFINFIQLLIMSQEKFDAKYNPQYTYYKQFNL